MKRLFAIIAVGIVLASCGGGTIVSSSPSTSSAPPSPTSPSPTPTIDAAAIFAANCSPCHGANRQGGVCPDITASALESRGRTDEYIQDIITNGRGGMPPWNSKLTQAQIEALLKFLRS